MDQSFAIVMAVGMVSAGSAWAQDEGVKQVQQLVKRANSTVGAINEAKGRSFRKRWRRTDSVLAPDTKDRRDAYNKWQKEMTNTEKKRAQIAERANEMNTKAEHQSSRIGKARRPASRTRTFGNAAKTAWLRQKSGSVRSAPRVSRLPKLARAVHEIAAGPGDVPRQRSQSERRRQPGAGRGQTQGAGG